MTRTCLADWASLAREPGILNQLFIFSNWLPNSIRKSPATGQIWARLVPPPNNSPRRARPWTRLWSLIRKISPPGTHSHRCAGNKTILRPRSRNLKCFNNWNRPTRKTGFGSRKPRSGSNERRPPNTCCYENRRHSTRHRRDRLPRLGCAT